MENPDLASRTLKHVSQALQQNRAAGLPEIVELVQTLSGKAQEISVQDLATIVEKDAAVLAKILSVANAFGYNPTRVPISSVAAAIQVIGFDRIRTMAISLLLFEQSNKLQTQDERREAAVGALFAGSFAKTAADQGTLVDAEEAFICASLRHFGRIVLCTFMPDEYRDAKVLSHEMDEDEAFQSMFGLTPVELGYELLRVEQLPPEILGALKQFKPEKAAAIEERKSVHRLAMADFATQISLLVFNAHLGQDEFAARTEALVKRFDKVLPGVGHNIPSLLNAAETYLSRFNEGLGSRVIPAKYLRTLNCRLAQTDPVKPAPKASKTEVGKSGSPDGVAGAKGPVTQEERANDDETSLGELENIALDANTSDLALNAKVISVLAKALEASECLLFLTGSGRDPSLRIAHGQGKVWHALQPRASIRPGERSTLGLCLQRRENILIHDAHDASIAQHTPDWLKNVTGLGAYILVPILDRNNNLALLLAGWPEKKRISVTPQCMETIRAVNRILPRSPARKR